MSLSHNESTLNGTAAVNMTNVRDAQGNFELRGVTPGSYTITAQIVEEGRRYVAQMPLEVGNTNVENVSLVVAPGLDLAGHVAVEGTADIRLPGLMIFLSGPEPFFQMGTIRAVVKEKGAFAFQNVLPDHYGLSMSNLPQNVYIKSIRLGTEDALESGLNLTRGAAGPLEILLASNGGQIDGTVLNAQQQPAAGATVVLVPESRLREQTRLYKSVVADPTGHFSVKGIAPGEYKLFAWEDVETGAYQDPDFLKPFDKLGESFSIREGSRENAQLKLIPAEKKRLLINPFLTKNQNPPFFHKTPNLKIFKKKKNLKKTTSPKTNPQTNSPSKPTQPNKKTTQPDRRRTRLKPAPTRNVCASALRSKTAASGRLSPRGPESRARVADGKLAARALADDLAHVLVIRVAVAGQRIDRDQALHKQILQLDEQAEFGGADDERARTPRPRARS